MLINKKAGDMKGLMSALVLVTVMTMAACGDKESDDGGGTLKIGAILSLTGNYAPLGSEDKKAVELAK